jgi:trimeric autotransporter adhesin
MTTKNNTTTALILATFALVGIMTTGAVVPAAFAQTTGTDLLDLLGDQTATDSNSDSNGITDEAETEEATTTQTEDQSEDNVQSNSIDQDQTGAINQEIGSGSGSEVASAAQSESESEYESKYKSKSKYGSTVPISGGTSTSTSDSASDVSNTGGLAQEQSLDSPVQVNTNTAGDDESRSAVVGFDLGFEQFTEQHSAVPGIGSSVPIVIP